MAKINGKDILFSLLTESIVKKAKTTFTPTSDLSTFSVSNPLGEIPDLVFVKMTSGTPTSSSEVGMLIFDADLFPNNGRSWTDDSGNIHFTVSTHNYGVDGSSYGVLAADAVKNMSINTTGESIYIQAGTNRVFSSGCTYTIDVYKGILGE